MTMIEFGIGFGALAAGLGFMVWMFAKADAEGKK